VKESEGSFPQQEVGHKKEEKYKGKEEEGVNSTTEAESRERQR